LSLEGLAEKGFGGGHIPLGAEAKVDRLTAGIHGAIEVHPAATNLDEGLVDAPRAADRACEAIPALLELRSVVLDPTQDGARCEGDTAFGHHRHEVSVREFVLEVPSHAEDDDLAFKLAPLEEILEARTLLAHPRVFARVGYRSPTANFATLPSWRCRTRGR
jgi:hypothetical protein